MSAEVQVGDRTIVINDFSGRKATRVLRVLEHIAKAVPDIQDKWTQFAKDYEAKHTTEIDRAWARSELRPQPVFKEVPVIVDGKALTNEAGNPLVSTEPVIGDDGKVVLGPDPLGHMTEEDWAASGQKLRQPRTPTTQEAFFAIFPDVLDLAENEVSKLLALIAMPDSEVKRHARTGDLWDVLAEQGDELLDAPLHQLVELMVVAGETLQEQYATQVADKLGPRVRAAARLIGLKLPDPKVSEPSTDATGSATSNDEPSKTRPNSSTDSPPPTGGPSEQPSTEPAGVASSASSSN